MLQVLEQLPPAPAAWLDEAMRRGLLEALLAPRPHAGK